MVLQDLLDSLAEGHRIVTETIRTLDAILSRCHVSFAWRVSFRTTAVTTRRAG